MANVSFVQTDFRSGIWSGTSLGRMNDERYKTALYDSLNGLATEQGPWNRRPGFRMIAIPRNGAKARLRGFRFSREEPYVAELTAGHLRFSAGLALVMDVKANPYVLNVTTDNPAKVYVSDVTGIANGDIVMFNLNTTNQLPSCPALYNVQYTVANVDATNNVFTLADSVSGANIDGAALAYIPRPTMDTVQRVLDFVTPYTEADLPYVRIVEATGAIYFLCRPPNSTGYAPYVLKQSGLTQFTFETAVFSDGPYEDAPADTITGFNNTLTLSANTGSVTVTAATTVGINNGSGFLSSDIGRLIRYQGGPANWSNAVSYAKDAVVLGSDSNIYKSVAGGNLNHNPTTDDGTYWQITAQVVDWTWLKITAVTDTTHCTATVEGDNPDNFGASTHWQMGLFGGTNGYPSCGTFHEDRLWLAGAIKNRFDGSRTGSSRYQIFSPTETDGTLSDDCGIAETLATRDQEDISAMLSQSDGMVVGTVSGEWMIRASVYDDPLTPLTVQARKASANGSKAIEFQFVENFPYFIQGAGRKLMAFKRNYMGYYECINWSDKATGLMAPSISDFCWVQEPMLSFFALRSDGVLLSCLHNFSQVEESYTGWFKHDHGYGRTFESITHGPDFTGNGDALFVTTWDGIAGHPRWIETIMPVFKDSDQNWVSWNVDGSTTASYIRRMIVANGDSFDGIRIYGLTYLNGFTVSPYIGGLDLGDFVVANGYIDIPYTATFTSTFLSNLNNGTDYSYWGIHLHWADAVVTTNPPYALNTVAVWDDPAAGGTVGSNRVLFDQDSQVVYRIFHDVAGSDVNDNIQAFDAYDGHYLRGTFTLNSLFNGSPGTNTLLVDASYDEPQCFVRADAENAAGKLHLFTYGSLGKNQVTLFNCTSLTSIATSNLNSAGDGTIALVDIKKAVNIPFQGTDASGNPLWSQLIFAVQQGTPPSALLYNVTHNVGALKKTSDSSAMPRFYQLYAPTTLTGMAEQMAVFAHSEPGLSVWYSWGRDGTGGLDTLVTIREWTIKATPTAASDWAVHVRTVGSITLSAIDASFPHMNQISLQYCSSDRTLIMFTLDSGGTHSHILKVSTKDASIVWNTSLAAAINTNCYPLMDATPLTRDRWYYMDNSQVTHVIDLTTGTVGSPQGTVTNALGSYGSYSWFDEIGPSLIMNANFSSTGTPVMVYQGPYASANAPTWTAEWNRLWLGDTYTQSQNARSLDATSWFIPLSIGGIYTSKGTLLRPDAGQDAGAVAGPAFGKKRRNHWWAAHFVNSFGVKIGTEDYSKLYPIKFQTPGGVDYAQPSLFTGIVSDTIQNDFSWEGKLSWQTTRQYPCTITAMGGYIATQDK